VVDGAGWRDKRERGRLVFEGPDAAAFLHALVSNDVASLQAGQGVYATYLTPQGRLLADLRIFRRADNILADVPVGAAERLAARFDQLIFAEDVRVADASSAIAQCAVVGADAERALTRAFGLDRQRLQTLPLWAQMVAADGWIARTDDVEGGSFDIFLPISSYAGLVARLADAGALPMSREIAEVLRIEAGRPAFGLDMTEDTIPLEAGLLERAISTTKGCYVGQEVIIRVLHRGGGRVAKRLVRVEFDPPMGSPPAAGTPLVESGQEVGRLTSAAWSPRRDRIVALGYVRRDVAEGGRRIAARLDAIELGGRIVGLAG
jgi:folate-binding protein YgfZ